MQMIQYNNPSMDFFFLFCKWVYDHMYHLWVMSYCHHMQIYSVVCITNAVIFPPPLMFLWYFQCHAMENRSYIKCRVIFLLDGWAMGLSKSVSQAVSFDLILPCQRNLWHVVVCIFPNSLFQEISKMPFISFQSHSHC